MCATLLQIYASLSVYILHCIKMQISHEFLIAHKGTMPARCWKYQNAHSFANKKTGIPGHHWPPLVFSIFALAAEPKAISWRFLSYIIRADEEEQKENLELPKTEGRGRLWGHRLENVEAHTIDMVRKLFCPKCWFFCWIFIHWHFNAIALKKIEKHFSQILCRAKVLFFSQYPNSTQTLNL